LVSIQNKKGDKMSVKDAKLQMKQLKKQIKSTNKENDLLLLKLFVLMIFLAVVAAVIHGKITLPI
jgi:uncharacterized ion transporter superfamily protein YfcC